MSVRAVFVLRIVASLVGAALLLSRHAKQGWWLAVGCSAATPIAYTLSRTVGLPSASDDIGNWLKSSAEGAVLLLSGFVLLEPAMRRLEARASTVTLDLREASEQLVAGG